MTDFRQDLHHYRSSKASPETGLKMDVANQFSGMTENMLPCLNETEFSVENFPGYCFQLPELATSSSVSEFPCVSLLKYPHESPVMNQNPSMVDSAQETMKRKAMKVSESSTRTPSAYFGCGKNLKNLQRGRKRRNPEKEQEKPGEVVHVRAKRGQATDSHSLAERVRREKINSKLKCLQNLIPGCHKTMGMAMVLDETINYVYSLQNQVEFLSMELAVACSSLGLNFGMEAITQALVPQEEVVQR